MKPSVNRTLACSLNWLMLFILVISVGVGPVKASNAVAKTDVSDNPIQSLDLRTSATCGGTTKLAANITKLEAYNEQQAPKLEALYVSDEVTAPTCYPDPDGDGLCYEDADGDGFIDDQCPEQAGPDSNCGCPLEESGNQQVDIVFVMDTSGSMADEFDALCSKIGDVVSSLSAQGVTVNYKILGITENRSCTSDYITNLIPGATSNQYEDWGPAIRDVSVGYNWIPGYTRLIVTMSDEAAEGGGTTWNSDDTLAVDQAIVAATSNNVRVAPVLASGYPADMPFHAQRLADATGGQVFYSTDPSNDLANGIIEIIQYVVVDSDGDGVPDCKDPAPLDPCAPNAAFCSPPQDCGVNNTPHWDDDGDGQTDEEADDGLDNDGDGLIDEDVGGVGCPYPDQDCGYNNHRNFDDDQDGHIDEESDNGRDDDGDFYIDEDVSCACPEQQDLGINDTPGVDDDHDYFRDEEDDNGIDDDGDGCVDEDVGYGALGQPVLLPVYPLRNSTPSEIMEDGLHHRYFRLRDADQLPISGADIGFDVVGYYSGIATSDRYGLVDISFDTGPMGPAPRILTVNVTNAVYNNATLNLVSLPSFNVNLEPHWFETAWRGGAKADITGGVGVPGLSVYLKGEVGGGMEFALRETDASIDTDDSLRIGRQYSIGAGVGAKVGVPDMPVSGVDVNLGPYAKAEIMFKILQEIEVILNDPYSDAQKKAEAALILATLMDISKSTNPLAVKLLDLLVQDNLYLNYLSRKTQALGIEGIFKAGLGLGIDLPITASEDDQPALDLTLFELESALVLYARKSIYPQENLRGYALEQGLEININTLQLDASATKTALLSYLTTTGTVREELFYKPYSFVPERLEIVMIGDSNVNGITGETKITFVIDGENLNEAAIATLRNLAALEAVSRGQFKNGFGIGVKATAVEIENLLNSVPISRYKVEVLHGAQAMPINIPHIELEGFPVKIGLGGGVELETRQSSPLKDGVVMINKKLYPLAEYEPYIGPSGKEFMDLMYNALNGAWLIVRDAFNSVVETISSGIDWVVGIFSSDGGATITGSTVIETSAPDNDLGVRALAPATVDVTGVSWKGDGFVVGNVYQFTPEELVFSPQASLAITYTQAVAADLPEARFQIYRYNEGDHNWAPMPSATDPLNNRVATAITRLGTFAIGYDNQEPLIDLFSPPVGGEQLNAHFPPLAAQLSDEGTGIDPASILLTLNGQAVEAQYDTFSHVAWFTPTLPMADGDYTVMLQARDMAGNQATYTRGFEVGMVGNRVYLPETIDGAYSGYTSVPYNIAPNAPYNPAPYNSANNQSLLLTLTWGASDPDGDDMNYDVYLSRANSIPDRLVCDHVKSQACDVGELQPGQQYYWQVVARDEHGAETRGNVWNFTTTSAGNAPPNVPANPSPPDGSSDQALDVVLSWMGGDPDGETVTYDVYFEANDLTPDVLVVDNQAATTYDPGALTFGTNYYWKVVAYDSSGASTEGPTWSFSTGSNAAPNVPSNPSPVDGALNQDVNVDLSWTGGDPDGDTVTYDIYLEANDSTPEDVLAWNHGSTSIDPGPLLGGTTYYWQVIAWDGQSSTPGPVWHFTTAAAPTVGPLVYAGHLVDDDASGNSNGNGDGIINCGETIEVWVDLYNQGNTTATTVNSVMDTSSPYITWIDSYVGFPDIPGGVTLTATDDFDFSIDPATPDGHLIELSLLNDAANGGPWTDSFWIQVTCANNPPYAPSNPSPVDGALNQALGVDLSWTGGDPDGDTVTYDVYFEANDATPDVLVSFDQSALTYDPGALLPATTYYWRIYAWDGQYLTAGPIWSFTTAAEACTPTLISPVEGAIMDNGSTNFTDPITWDFDWADCTGATYYHLYVISQSASGPAIDNDLITSSAYHSEISGVAPSWSVWDWRVRAYVGGQWGPWSATRSFIVEQANNPPDVPTNPFPADGATNQYLDTSLSWSGGDPDGHAVTYDVFFEANDSTPDILVSNDQAASTYDPGGLAANTTYYWQIIARDDQTATRDGPVWQFTTGSIPTNLFPIVEEFDSTAGFVSTDPDVYIQGGLVHWNVARDQGQQYVYRSIPAFSGDVRLTVVGQIDSATNNCGVLAGIGDDLGSGIAASYNFFGGGCPVQGYLIRASGVTLNQSEHLCTDPPDAADWLWINNGQAYTATLTIAGSAVDLSVPGVGSASGSPVYNGTYNTLYVGMTGGGDWPSCAGTIERMLVEPLGGTN